MQLRQRRATLSAMLCSVTAVLVMGAAGPAEDVKARYGVLSAAVAAKDLAKVASLYSAGATFQIETPNSRDRVTGRESIMEMWQGAIQGGAVGFEATVTEATTMADVLTEKGTFVMKKKDGTLFLKGAHSGTWRREAGVWKITSHRLVGQ